MVVIGVLDLNDGDAPHPDAFEQCFFYLTPTVFIRHFRDDKFFTTWFVLEHVHLAHQLLGQKTTEEGDVAINITGFKHCLGAGFGRLSVFLNFLTGRIIVSSFDIIPEFQSDMIWIKATWMWP